MLCENTASRSTDTSAEVLVGPPGRMVSNAGKHTTPDTSAADLHVIGIDPGKRELAVCVDADDPKDAPVVRYTLAQRRRDLRTRKVADLVRCTKPAAVADAERQLSELNSKAPSLDEYARFSARRRAQLRERAELADFYADLAFRERRWTSTIKAQQSEARLVKRLKGMHAVGDPRRLVLAYGAWGLVPRRPGTACNKGNAPALGIGLMRRLARDFVVAPTPEHYTCSKTCVGCGGFCGAHPTRSRPRPTRRFVGYAFAQTRGVACGRIAIARAPPTSVSSSDDSCAAGRRCGRCRTRSSSSSDSRRAWNVAIERIRGAVESRPVKERVTCTYAWHTLDMNVSHSGTWGPAPRFAGVDENCECVPGTTSSLLKWLELRRLPQILLVLVRPTISSINTKLVTFYST